MDLLNNTTIVVPTDEELLANCPDSLNLNDEEGELANEIIVL
ncbi:hypothetical protein [Photobacterium rosenbergii]|uniref:Uncharacterized protein n=1 Tax=Photobacterium rosenbergii TaxID=294936 RepID=A0ABU3ZJR6_9GAMM|nr:hypothetical protein [Photobacterium rosenbergii]MDV5170259.1 hypothetical protein [Photobacterium rosenbergii]